MGASVKHELHQLAEALPENATWDDVIEEARFRRAVEAGVHAADRAEDKCCHHERTHPLPHGGGV
jgi:hypothetical protein